MIPPANGGRTGEIGAADDEDARRPLDQSMSYVLTRPLYDGPVMIREITFREPTAKDIARWSRAEPTDAFAGSLEGIALLTGVEPRVMENLSARDFVALAHMAAELFEGV